MNLIGRFVFQGLMWSFPVMQAFNTTPTLPTQGKFCIAGTPGMVAGCGFSILRCALNSRESARGLEVWMFDPIVCVHLTSATFPVVNCEAL